MRGVGLTPRNRSGHVAYPHNRWRAEFEQFPTTASATVVNLSATNAVVTFWDPGEWFKAIYPEENTPTADPRDHEEYKEARAELERVKDAATEEGCPEPSDETVEEAGELLRWMFCEAQFPYDVAPEDDGGIAIHAIHDEVYVCVILSSEGPDRCFVNIDGESRRSTYTDRRKVYGTFLKGALEDLRRYAR